MSRGDQQIGRLALCSACQRKNLRRPGLLDLVDADHRVDRDQRALDPRKLVLELLLVRIDDHFGLLAPNELLDFDEAEQRAGSETGAPE